MNNHNSIAVDFNLWIEGNDRAFEGIFSHFYPQFFMLSKNITQNREVAEELSMNAMMKIWQIRYKTTDIRKVDDYLFGILRQQLATYLRKRIIKTIPLDDLEEQEHLTSSDSTINYREILECYYSAISKLSPQQQKIFLMSREEYLSNKEIADRLGLSVHTINNHIKASLKVLKSEFDEIPHESIGFILFALGFFTKK